MKYSKNGITTLDIQDKYISCAQVWRRFDHSWYIQKKATKEIPALEDTEDSSLNINAINAIKSLLQEMELYPPKKLVTYINGRDAAVKILALPPLSGKNIENAEQIINYELMANLPIKMEQMGYDYQIIEKGENDTKALAAAAKSSVLQRYLRLLSLAGIYPDVITASPIMVFNAFVDKDPEAIKNGIIGILCLRDSSGDVIVCEDGNLSYTRSFAFQPNRGKDQLLKEIHNSFGAYSRSSASKGENSLQNIHIMTDNGELPEGLTKDDLSRIMPEVHLMIHPAEDYLSIGLAMSDASIPYKSKTPKPLRINLLKQIIQEKLAAKRKAIKAKLAYISPAIIALILLVISGMIWWQVYRAESNLHFIKNEQQLDKQRVDLVSELTEIEGKLQKQIEALGWSAESRPMFSYMLYQVANTIPENLRLKEVYIPEAQISKKKEKSVIPSLYIVGYGNEQHDIGDFINNLRACDCFSDVKQESTLEVRVAGKIILEFTLELIYKKAG